MLRSNLNIPLGSVDTSDREAHPRHRLGNQATAATDIEQAQPLERPNLGVISPEMAQQPLPQIA
jgi:hypothetical protein